MPTKAEHQVFVSTRVPFATVLPSFGAKALVQGEGKTHT